MKETAIVIGAGSGLGHSLCQHLAARGYDLILSSRDEHRLLANANDLQHQFGINAIVLPLDLSKIDEAGANDYIRKCIAFSDAIHQIYITAGIIRDEDTGVSSIQVVREIFDTNFFGITLLFSKLAERFRNTETNITVISSISAARPREQNISYSSSKIAMEYFILGIKHYFRDSPVNIQIYRVGYMDTVMTTGKKLMLPLASTNTVAGYIYKNRREHFQIRYYPRFWKYIVLILSRLPWFIYKRLKF